MASSGFEPATFRLVAQRLNQLSCYYNFVFMWRGSEQLRSIPANRRMRRKESYCLGVKLDHYVTGRHKCMDSSLGLDASLKTLLYKKDYCCKIQRSETRCNLTESFKESCGLKGLSWQWMMMIIVIIVHSMNTQQNAGIKAMLLPCSIIEEFMFLMQK
jgi:hypothetical protein